MDVYSYNITNNPYNYNIQFDPETDHEEHADPGGDADLLFTLQKICQHISDPDSKYIPKSLAMCNQYLELLKSFQGENASSIDFKDSLPDMSTKYWHRFIPYTVASCLAVVFNAMSVLAMVKIRAHWSSHHLLLLNLAVCDIVGAVMLWMYHNSPVLFPHFTITTLSHCLFISVVIVAPFILTLCNSSCNLLLLALNLYLAICHPLFSATKVTKFVVRAMISLTWLGSILLATVPVVVMLYRNRSENCKSYAVEMGENSLEISAYGLVAFILLTIVLYGRIYFVIWKYRRYTSALRNNTMSSRENKYKAFLTTLLLAGALFCFWLPYMIFHFITAHLDAETLPDAVWQVKFYFIDFLPVLHFLTDPAIYGLRITEIRRGYRKLCCWKRKSAITQQPSVTSTRATLRYSTHVYTTTAV